MESEPLDVGLVDAVRSGRAVLFLGAGASVGAHSAAGKLIPTAFGLKTLIAERFLGNGYEDADFKTVCDYAASASSVRDLQLFLYETLNGYEPAAFHKLIPQFVWAGLATTNYDLVIETAYKNSPSIQELVPFCVDGDGGADNVAEGKLLYVKLHGCITHYQNVTPPLVASTEHIIHYREGRNAQFSQFLEWAKTKTVIFVGYGMGDANLRTLFDEIVKEGDARPLHYFVRPNIKPIEEQYWSHRRVKTISTSFQALLARLDLSIPLERRKLALFPTAFNASTFTRFIGVSGRQPTSALVSFLQNQCEHLSTETTISGGEPSKFYQGFDVGWFPFKRGLDVRRQVTSAILNDHVLPTTAATDPRLIILKAHAGAGKSVTIRRTAWETAISHDRFVLFANSSGALNVQHFEEIFSLVRQTVYLFVDDVGENASDALKLLRRARHSHWPLIMVAGVRVNEWNVKCEDLHPLLDDEYELKYLTPREIDELLAKLESFNCLGYLASIPSDKRPEHLKERYGRQLLVALHEATKNASFREIIRDEYDNIYPEAAKLLYLDVCSLHRFGPPVRAGLIGRVHGLRFEDFQDQFFLPLEQVIDVQRDSSINDWVYKARHSFIAQMVYDEVLRTTEDKFDNIIRIVTKLNSAYSYDRDVVFQIIRASNLVDIFQDRDKGRAIYDAASRSAGREAYILQQRGIYEMRLGNDISSLDKAEKLFKEALAIHPGNSTIRHSLAELALKRSLLVTNEQEKVAWRRLAEQEAANLAKSSLTCHPHHTLAKAAIATVKEALPRAEVEDSDLAHESFSNAVRSAEDVLRKGLQQFPNEPFLLNEEANLAEILKNADRSLKALSKAFERNSRSELIARRLARVLRAKGRFEQAIHVLRTALEHSPGNQVLNFDMAQTIREETADGDIVQAEAVLYHLQRAFTPGDRSYEAQFWYARQLCLCGQQAKAKPFFGKLKRIQIPLPNKRGLRGLVLDSDGSPRTFYGVISHVEKTYGFIKADWNDLEVFIPLREQNEMSLLEKGDRVIFKIGFTLAGPIAFEASPA